MAKQPMSRSLGGAGLPLLVAVVASLVTLLAEARSWLTAVLLLGLTAVLAGVAGLCVFGYRHSRSTGDGVLKSLGSTALAAVKVLPELLP